MGILETQNVTKKFDGVKALDDVSFSPLQAQTTSLIGPNGSGKTTLFNVITGFLSPASGKVFFNSQDITNFPPYKIINLGIGRLWQDVRVFSKLTALENVLLAVPQQGGENPFISLTMRKKVKQVTEEALNQAKEALEFVELDTKASKLAEDLSYGEQKLLVLARCLAGKGNLLLLDEPVSGIDLQMVNKIKSFIKQLIQQKKTVIIIEHNFSFVQEISDYVVLLNEGRVVATGKPSEIFNNEIMKEAYLGI